MEGDTVATLLESHIGPWSPSDLDLLPEHWKVELLDGILLVNAQPMPLHIAAARRLTRLLEDAAESDWELLPGVMLDLGETRFAPDVAVARKNRVAWGAKHQSPDAFVLVAEVASPSTRVVDRTVKAEKYAEAGIPAYWRIDLDPVVTVVAHALRGGAYVELGSWRAGETVTVDDPVRVRFDPADLLP
jgi:Uma2 family endonuclease